MRHNIQTTDPRHNICRSFSEPPGFRILPHRKVEAVVNVTCHLKKEPCVLSSKFVREGHRDSVTPLKPFQ
jgi:hypothetical protein